MSMLKIQATTVAKAASKSKFAGGDNAVPSHKEIMAKHKEQASRIVHHDERNDQIKSRNEDVNYSSEYEPNTYFPNFPLDDVIMIDQPRKKIDIESCLELARSVSSFTEDGGPLYEHPVSAWYCPDRKKMVVKNGHRRTTGAKEANWKTINLIVVERQEELKRSFDQVMDNIHVESMDAFDLAFKFKEWCDLGISYSKIAERLSISKTKVANYVTLAKLPPSIIEFGMLYLSDDVGAYVELSKLYKLDETAAKQLISDCIEKGEFSRKIAKSALAQVKKPLDFVDDKSSDSSTHFEFEGVTVDKLKTTVGRIIKSGHKDVGVFVKTKDGGEQELTGMSILMTDTGPKVVISVD